MTDNNAFNDNNINGFMNNDTGNPNQPIWSPDDTIYNTNQSYYNANNASNNVNNNSVINYNDTSNASNNAYNTNIISNNNYAENYDNPSSYNASNANASTIREPKSFNREQFQSKLTEQDNKHSSIVVKIITIFPFIFFIGIFGIITLSGFHIEHSINNIVSKYDAAPTASYADKIKVNATLLSYTEVDRHDYNYHTYNGGVNGIPAQSESNNNYESSDKTTVNNSNYMLDTNANMQTIIPARYHHSSHSSSSSDDDGPHNEMSISGTVTNTDTKEHSFILVFRTAKPDNDYKGVYWETFTLKPGESNELDDMNIAIKNLPLIDITNPKIIDGNYKASSFGILSTTTKSKYQFDWNTK